MRRSLHAGCFLLAVAGLCPAPAHAAYPDRPIHLVVPFSPGGGVDVIARLVAHRLGERINQAVIVENRSGAGGNIANQYVARAAPDGYTLLMASPAAAINATLDPNAGYHFATDLVPVAAVLSSTMLLVVASDSPIHDVRDLIARAHTSPGALNYASAGVGSSEHLAGELFGQMAEIAVVHVPYKGSGLAMNDLLGGQVQFMFGGAAGLLPQVQAGQLRALAQTGKTPQPDMPDIPTMDQAGVPKYDVIIWNGVMAPKGTPPGIIEFLNTEISATADDLAPRFKALGGQAMTMTPWTFRAVIADQIAKWAAVIEKANVHAN